ncbi:MAG: hypothetical protein JW750_10225 [Anaerolineaceae bacterium]|nr:hypothetical protein [Anaerolineaceae bacterium]
MGRLNHKWGAIFAPLLFLVILAAVAIPISTVNAQGGIAMTGTFYNQVFEIPLGAEVSASSVYVVVLNNSEDDAKFKMSSEAPAGVEISFSESEITVPAGGQVKIFITVRVGNDAVPGQYELVVRATQIADEVDGELAVTSAVGQKADLIIVGESANVSVQVLSATGEPILASVRLFKLINGSEMEFASGEMGVLDVKVSAGSYRVSAFVAGQKLAEESFDVAAGESRMIVLSGSTVYIGGYGLIPNYSTETGDLVFAEVVYTINNFYQPMPEVEVLLKIGLDGNPLEETSLVTFEPLNSGRTGGSYKVIPAAGWKEGEYAFRLELYSEGKLYTRTQDEVLVVKSAAGGSESTINLVLLISIAIVGLLSAAGIFFWYWRKKQRGQTR